MLSVNVSSAAGPGEGAFAAGFLEGNATYKHIASTAYNTYAFAKTSFGGPDFPSQNVRKFLDEQYSYAKELATREGGYPRCDSGDPNAVELCTGVLGFVPGIIGVMQAQEAIKVVTGFGRTLSGRMLYYDAEDCRQFMAKLRGRRPECAACGLEATVSSQFSMPHDDAAVTCAKPPPSYPNRWTPARLAKALGEGSGERVVLLDVRSDNQHAMCALHGSVSVPYETSLADAEALAARAPDLEAAAAAAAAEAREDGQALHIVCYCRRGNDSQLAAARLEPLLHAHASVVDLEGGLNAWRRDVDEAFPVY